MKKGIFYRKFPYGENVYVLASVLSQNFCFGRTSFGENLEQSQTIDFEGKILKLMEI
jgi:hypothetical protein